MRGSSFGYLVKEGFRNIYQNRIISIAAIGVLVACLLLVGVSMLFTINVNEIVGYFESQNEIVVFLVDDARGEGGFGYDPYFYYPPFGKTFAEMTAEEKNRISHRGKAIERLAEALKPILE